MVKRELFKKLGLTLLVLFLCFITAFCGQGNYLSASADSTDSVQANYESTNVLNNLKGSTIGGKEFDLADYPHNSKGKPQVISFVEFCYSYYAEKQSDYGLYVYVYNPQELRLICQPFAIKYSLHTALYRATQSTLWNL